jgi:2-haloacid dehalogenase
MLGGTFAESVDVLQKLRESGQYRIYALSNWSAETFPMARARFDFFKNFDGILISGEEKMVKPQLSFFRLLETRYGVVPERSVFIDDLERNLIPAREIGYRTIHVSDPAKIAESLRALKFDF